MTSLNLPHYLTFLVLSNMRVSVLIKVVIMSDGFSMTPPVGDCPRCKAKIMEGK